MFAYQDKKEDEFSEFIPGNTKYSKAYYTRKVNLDKAPDLKYISFKTENKK